MINRREIMASGLALTMLGRRSAAQAGTSGQESAAGAVPVFIADARFAQARAAARTAAARGAAIRFTNGDITPVYEYLDLALRETTFAISGLTSQNALFVLERLGWDRGLRTRVRIGSGREGDWAAALISILDGAPAASLAPARRLSLPPLPGTGGGKLAAWLLVPRSGHGRDAG